jgi:hypothetical protein
MMLKKDWEKQEKREMKILTIPEESEMSVTICNIIEFFTKRMLILIMIKILKFLLKKWILNLWTRENSESSNRKHSEIQRQKTKQKVKAKIININCHILVKVSKERNSKVRIFK